MGENGNEKSVCTAKNRPFLVARNSEHLQAIIFRPRCKSWSCPACAEVNKSLWAIRAYQGARAIMDEGQTLYFLTLTSHEKLTANQALWVWPKAWAKLRDRMKYAAGGVFHYIMIPEKHESGKLHVHAIESAGLGNTWVKKNARKSGMGYIDEEKRLRTPTGAAWYTTKYLTKSLEFNAWPAGFRRIRTSQSWPKMEKLPPPDGWEFFKLPDSMGLDQQITQLEDVGYHVEILNHLIAWELVNGEGDQWGEV